MIKMIVAATYDGVIGVDGGLPWMHQKDDMRHFKEQTMGNVVVMGRTTFESMGSKPLLGRVNVIVSNTLLNKTYKEDKETNTILAVKDSFESAIGTARLYADNFNNEFDANGKTIPKDVFIIGGGQIYERALLLDIVDEIILTTIFTKARDHRKWQIMLPTIPSFFTENYDEECITVYDRDERNQYPYSIRRFVKIKFPE